MESSDTPATTTFSPGTHDSPIPPKEEEAPNDDLLATWSSNTTCSYNGIVLSFEGSLGFDGRELFQQAHVALERGSIYGLVAPNGSGKTSLVRALPALPNFPTPSSFRVEYIAADFECSLPEDASTILAVSTSVREYCQSRVVERAQELEQEIEELEILLETTGSDNDLMEMISNQLAEMYETKDYLELEATTKAEEMFLDLNFGSYPDQPFVNLSSGWKYKCELLSALLTQPDLIVIDEPSFLDIPATEWLVSQLQRLAKSHNSMIVLISHKETLMEELCDRILYLNPASRTLTLYHCGFREFQVAHADRVKSAQKSKDLADVAQQQARQSLGQLRQELNKREQNFKARTTQNADKRFVKGKNKEAKQKADHSAAAKLTRLQKAVKLREQEHAQFLKAKVTPLELQGSYSVDDKPIVELVDVDFKYDDSQDALLEYVNLQISGVDKILVQGANGQGKSTLAKLVLGQLEPTNGSVRRREHTIAHFHQDALFELIHRHGHTTPIDFLQLRNKNLAVTDARIHLGRFGLKGNIPLRQIRTLSAGQRVRLWLAREFLDSTKKPSLLILDEVTENLDKETTASLLESLAQFSAAVMAISHDRYFCQGYPATQIWTVGNGRARPEFK